MSESPNITYIFAATASAPLFDRGFTGHEHLYDFGLINMNGRMYDPIMSSFLSVDNYVQSPENSQNFNRYAYCLNNPLKYTDPSGEMFVLDDMVIGMFVGAAIGVAMNGVNNYLNGQSFFNNFCQAASIGALSGLAGGLFGGVANCCITAFDGFYAGAISGAASGFAGGFTGGTCNALYAGATDKDALLAGLLSGGIGALTGGVIGGIANGVSARNDGYDFWDGSSISEFSGDGLKLHELYPNENFDYDRYMNDIPGEDQRLANRASTYFESDGSLNRSIGVDKLTTDGRHRGYVVQNDGTYLNNGKTSYGMTYRVRGKYTEMCISPYAASHPNSAIFIATVGHEYIHAYHYYLATLSVTDITNPNTEWEATNYTAEVFDHFGMKDVSIAFRNKMRDNPLMYIQNPNCVIPKNYPFSLGRYYIHHRSCLHPGRPWQ